jgi:predicted nucleic acid-binding protein
MRVVVDTNQLVASLVRPPELATFLMTWEAARFTVVASVELIYPELLRMYQSHLGDDIEIVDTPEIPTVCRDPVGDKVIATAMYGLADFILTVDRDLQEVEITEKLSQIGIQWKDPASRGVLAGSFRTP